MDNQISTIVKQSGLQESKSETLIKSFTEYFAKAKEIVDECKGIIVTSEDEIDLMRKAREYRLKLKDIRVESEKTRKELKEQSLRECRAIDGIANVIKALIIPIEEHLEKQEKYAEIQEQLRIERRLSDRIERLSKYVSDISPYNIRDMDDEVFENLLSGCKSSWEKARKEEEEAEAKRIADEKAKIERQKQIEEENRRLREEAERQMEIVRKANEERERAEAKLRAEKEAQQRKELEAKIAEEARKRAKEEEEMRKLLAPDKEKLLQFATTLSTLHIPAVKNRQAQNIVDEACKRLRLTVLYLQDEAKKL